MSRIIVVLEIEQADAEQLDPTQSDPEKAAELIMYDAERISPSVLAAEWVVPGTDAADILGRLP